MPWLNFRLNFRVVHCLRVLSAEKMLVQGFHYPFPSVAHVEKTATGYREIPMPWSPVI